MTHLSTNKYFSFYAPNPSLYDFYFYCRLVYYKYADYGNIHIGNCEVSQYPETIEGRYIFKEKKYESLVDYVSENTPFSNANVDENFFNTKTIISSSNSVEYFSKIEKPFFVLDTPENVTEFKKLGLNILNAEEQTIYQLIAQIDDYLMERL